MVISMIKFVSAEKLSRTKPVASDFLLKFKDADVNKAQSVFEIEHLDNYNQYMNSEYKITFDAQYNESVQLLIIGLIVTIPDRLIPDEDEKLVELWMDLVKGFLKFYEQDIEPLKP